MNTHKTPSKGPALPKERRRAKRSALRMRANVTLPGDLTLEAHTVDISLNGLSCRVPYALEPGHTCVIELDLKRFDSGQVELQATVRNCRETPEGKFLAGLEFLAIPDNIQEVLRSLLR